MGGASAAQVATFINMIAPIAVRQAKKHNNKIYPSVCIAQACVESAYGTSPKMKRANAVFGIKVGQSKYHFGTAWKDKAYSTQTKECYDGKTYQQIQDLFRAYDSIEDATEDYFDLLCTAKRYKAAVNASDYKACIRAIAPSYATAENKDHSYSKSVINIIEKYGLTKYDNPATDGHQVNPYTLTSTLMKMGARSSSVKWLQWELNRHGANLKIDGVFGQQTKLAVLLYQKDHGLVQDGIVGKKTIESLRS